MGANADCDVAVVGGGPAGCSAGVFCAREGLETVVFDRGRSSIRRCAHLENYLGFPAGIDVETLYGLMHAQVERAGCTLVSDLVESVDRRGDARADADAAFLVTPQDGEPVLARRVIAATRYDGEYLRGLDDDDAMFETYERDGERREHFDRGYAARDGTTPVDGLYVATPSDEDRQAIVAAGRGARVASRVIADARADDGWWDDVAEDVDWMRRKAQLEAEWRDRETWLEWFDDHYGADAPVDPDTDRFGRVREESIDATLSTYLTDDEIDARAGRGHRALAAHLRPAAIVEAVGADPLLEAIDDDAIEAYLETADRSPERDRSVP